MSRQAKFGISILGVVAVIGFTIFLNQKSRYKVEGQGQNQYSSDNQARDTETGGSYLNQLIQENGGEIPYPFNRLLLFLFSKVSTDQEDQVQVVLVPKGRSLAKTSANFENPRIDAALGERYPIFFGYAPLSNQIEVISFNPSRSGYDFQEILDYRPGGKPRIEMAKRELCLQCHQHGGPIFPRSPWREMRERRPGTEKAFFEKYGQTSEIPSHDKDYNLVAQAILDARHGDKNYQGIDLEDYLHEQRNFQGRFTRGPASTYAFFLRLSNWSLQKYQVAKNACVEDRECRLLLLRSTLLFSPLARRFVYEGKDKVLSIFHSHEEALQKTVQNYWPKNGFAYPSPVLPDVQVLGRTQPVGFVIRPKVGDTDFTYFEMLGDYVPSEFYYLYGQHPEDFKGIALQDFREEVVKDDRVLDPTTPRPLVNEIPVEKAGEFLFSNSIEGLGFSPADSNLLMTLNYDQVKTALASDKYREFTYHWPPDPRKVMATLLSDLKMEKEAQAYLAKTPVPVRFENPAFQSKEEEFHASKNLFIKYCASCHIDEKDRNYLPLQSLAKLSQSSEICQDLRQKTMPPKKYRWQPSDGEREEMLKLLDCRRH